MTVYQLTGAGTDHEVDPVSRIEGHLGVKVRVGADGKIVDANAHGNLWRGFENFLLGREANDAITFVQRICGVCPVPHGLTSTYAVDTVFGYSEGHITFAQSADGYGVPEKAVLIRNLVLSAEFLMSSITHFYHLAAPSYVQGPAIPPWTPYFDDSQYNALLLSSAAGAGAVAAAVPGANPATMQLWDAVIISYVRALKIRRLTFEAAALFAGRMPMTSCFVAGGVTNHYEGTELADRVAKFTEIIRNVGDFIVKEYVPIALALGFLYPEWDNINNTGLGGVQGLGYGGGLGRFLAWGGFPNLDDTLTLPGGIKDTTGLVADFTVADKAQVKSRFLAASGQYSVKENLKEYITNSRYSVATADTSVYSGGAAYPGDVSRTKPNRAAGYSYIKSPRWAGKACEVGPFARLAVADLYPVDGRTLAAVVPGYTAVYTNAGGFRASAVAPTIVNGLNNLDGGAGAILTAVIDWIVGLKGGLSTMDRLRARALESLVLVQKMVGSITAVDDLTGEITWGTDGWAQQLAVATGDTWAEKPLPVGVVQGWGGTEAPRGALMHQVTIDGGKITKYQCIVPTTWNGSPKANGERGAIEESCIGVPFASGTVDRTANGRTVTSAVGGVEVLRCAQSFDPCIACAIH